VGGACGGLFLGYELLAGAPAQSLVLYLQVPILALCGLIAGTAGARFRGAAPKIDVPIPNATGLSSLGLMEEERPSHRQPTLWFRVIAGAALMVLGAAVADHVREAAQRYSGGVLRVQGMVQGEFITWQLATFAVVLGGMLAGVNTGTGA